MNDGSTVRRARSAPDPGQPSGCTNLKLRQLTRQVTRLYDARLAACGLRTTQYSLLASIDRLGPLPPGDLARALSMDPSTLTRNLEPLVEAGWVELAAGPDARSRRVLLTDDGRRTRARARGRWRRAQQELNEALGIARVVALHALIEEAQQRLEGRDRVRGAGRS